MTISNLVLAGFSDKKQEPINAIKHLYTDEEWQAILDRKAEQEELEAERMQIAKLMRLSR